MHEKELADGILAIVKAATDPLRARIKVLEEQVERLTKAPSAPTDGPRHDG